MIPVVLGLLVWNSAASNLQVSWSQTTENKIQISWTDKAAGSDVRTYRVFRKTSTDDWRPISTFTFGTSDTVRVLNVYPVVDAMASFQYATEGSSGSTRWTDLPKSAALRVWMEGGVMSLSGTKTSFAPAGRYEKTGQQLITVHPVSMADFNRDPSILWDGFDVMMFGTWDGNGAVLDNLEPSKLNSRALSQIEKFIQRGYGVLTGHDTITGFLPELGLSPLRKYFDIKLGCNSPSQCEIQDGWRYNSDQIRVVKKGFVTSFPWDLPTTQILTIPLTHTVRNAAYGDIWINLVNGDWDNGGSELKPTHDSETYHYFLTTKDNTGMIQTGHSSCESTEYERKVLANALYYIKQRTNRKWMVDYDIFDTLPPSVPTCTQKDGGHGQIELVCHSQDQSEIFRYYVESRSASDESSTEESGRISVNAASGFSHFVYWRDDSASSSSSASQIARDPFLVNRVGPKYVHVQAVDRAGNRGPSAVFEIISDLVPTMSFSPLEFDSAMGRNWYVPASLTIAISVE